MATVTSDLAIKLAYICDDPAGRHLGRSGPTDPPQKEQCRKTVRTVLRTRPGVQRPKAPTTN